MARTGITRDQVFEAASKLKSQGMQITMQRIREALGETGSFTTISRLLEEWRVADSMKDRETLPEVPEAAEHAMHTAVRELWRIAAVTAHREVAAAREAAEQRVKEADDRYAEARVEVERLEKVATAAGEEVQRLRLKTNQLEKDLGATKAAEAELRDRVKAEADRNKALEERMGELNKELLRLAAGRDRPSKKP